MVYLKIKKTVTTKSNTFTPLKKCYFKREKQKMLLVGEKNQTHSIPRNPPQEVEVLSSKTWVKFAPLSN